ncbi:hypothetical protein AX15_002495 [Amanita polypyramis BW_CC]|nr:hypothetical protein AX15_002495 [Amanita polypyramis BW_CC]
MSRHRHVRSINVHDELEDGALSDGADYDMTVDQQEEMEAGLEEVRNVIGDDQVSGLSDATLKDALWEYYFDVSRTIQWAIDERERRRVAQERKEDSPKKGLPPLPENMEESSRYSEYPLPWLQQPVMFDGERPRIPLIHLAQQQLLEEQRMREMPAQQVEGQEEPQQEYTQWQIAAGRRPLTPIPEEGASKMSVNRTSTVTSYGNVIEDFDSSSQAETIKDPNMIPVSVPASAIYRYAQTDTILSNRSDISSALTPQQPQKSLETLPSLDKIPDIPDPNSKASLQLPSRAESELKPKKSKLSSLASSKARSITSQGESSRSTGTVVTGTIKTYPGLRPTAQSLAPPSTIAPSFPDDRLSATVSTSASSHVRRAIQVALEQEARDKVPALPMTSPSSSHLQSSKILPFVESKSDTSKELNKGPQRLSKLALLAQARADPGKAPTSSTPKPEAPGTKGAEGTTNKEPQPLSKLAMLAQTKIDPSKIPKLPKTTTEYLTPIANGPTVTTAITTSYQSFFSLTDPSRSSALPKLNLVSVSDALAESSSPQKRSTKLAMRIKKVQQQNAENLKMESEETLPVVVSPMFGPKSTDSRALPSEFASLLINDAQSSDQKNGRNESGESKHRKTGNKTARVTSARRNPRRGHKVQAPPPSSPRATSAFDGPSPDDIVLNARRGTSLGQSRSAVSPRAAKEREKVLKKVEKKTNKSNATSPSSSRISSALSTPVGPHKKLSALSSGASTPTRESLVDQRLFDLSGLNLDTKEGDLAPVTEEPLPMVNYVKEKLVEEMRRSLESEGGEKKSISLVVIGHVDAGKSTLMGRLLYELGKLDQKTRVANERASSKIGKSSFSWAWNFDGTTEERERGITMDIGLQSISTDRRDITILDAPGHKDFIPNMISGASQADCSLLVIDAAIGEFEAGFERGGQTREHLLLVRSLGVTQLIVAVNKLDQVQWDKARYTEICGALRPFLAQSGFIMSKTSFVPVGAMQGVNLVSRDSVDAKELRKWYRGPTLVDLLDKLEPPSRDYLGPLRIPISNVFKSQGSSVTASGRICSGVVQVGEKLRVLPGDETAVVKSIDTERINAPWAPAGSNATLYLTAIDLVHLNIGSVLCSPSDLVPLVSSFTARIIVFDIQLPIMTGISVELFHHSHDLPATVSKLLTILDRATGTVIRPNPRFLTKGVSAEVEISLRTASRSGALSSVPAIPLEPFSVNKEMGRILLRRGGETIAAGIVVKLAS